MRVLLVCLALLAMPATAAAQSSPFGPLPQPQSPAVTPEATPSPAQQGRNDRRLLLIIAGGVALLFVGIGWYISRDARQILTDDDRRSLEQVRDRDDVTRERRQSGRTKKKARAKTRAQKQARKKQRR